MSQTVTEGYVFMTPKGEYIREGSVSSHTGPKRTLYTVPHLQQATVFPEPETAAYLKELEKQLGIPVVVVMAHSTLSIVLGRANQIKPQS